MLRRAFPGGLTNVFAVLVCQAFMTVFWLPQEEVSTICAAILSVVGLLVLFQVCKPFNFFRGLMWAAMAAGIVVCFTLLGDVFNLNTWTTEARLVMMTLLIMTPTVFFFFQRLFDDLERLVHRISVLFQKLWEKLPFRKKKTENEGQ